ncbi:response regulator transcription factor [Actinosynnema pretiosum subsp. pretiosum]|uniref:Two component transcriptional regulator, winged helix family n=2 Tax=Actinosynnema TaxID=40566 RepID=C6WMN8_ACTMD|nr:response regulator transcription factor [Actinosynnema mirum]ACU36567.1 two component transcriptional regulator, winged helix family [Actinosynnema mirum DSM 43827]AXX30021.1 two-component response regulator [Actinosynnema pretiosum subsp. pretiosum]QUF05801.1 response regulator transcription factor [Actinosynnema pretiosum subsp. pretiosum]
MHILVVDDEVAVAEAVTRTLRFEGYEVTTAHDGAQALDLVRSLRPDGVILDVTMPVLGGLDACRALRASGDTTPVLMLTARAEVSDRVAGLDAGADDYLAKPFALQELLARVRALVRRGGYAGTAARSEALRFADLLLDAGTREVRRGDRQVALTRTEFSILETFLRNPRLVLSREAMFRTVWGHDFGAGSNGLDVYVGYLRRKLEQDGEPRLIHTVRGVGYVLREDPL